MTELKGIGEVEEIQVQEHQQVPLPAIQEVIKESIITLEKNPTPQGTMTLLSFVTPVKQYTFVLSDEACELISENIRPSRIVPATLMDLPR